MIRPFSRLVACRRASAAVEMALVTPLLVTLMFGSFELGNYFMDSHVVAKAVRDGARYAARRAFDQYTCSTVSSDVIDKTRNIIRTGQVASGGTARLPGWSDSSTISVAASCDATTVSGIYTGMTGGARIVTVTAAVPYNSLFNSLGFSSTTLTLRARAQAAVAGI